MDDLRAYGEDSAYGIHCGVFYIGVDSRVGDGRCTLLSDDALLLLLLLLLM